MSSRKGTLDGLHPDAGKLKVEGPKVAPPTSPVSVRGSAAFAYADPTEDDFDAEKTMVVDPDDAPTADYDPRAHAPASSLDVHARSAPPRSRPPMSNPPPTDLREPVIPAAPQAPSFDGPVPSPRPSEMSRRKSSRRTVKIPDDPTRAKSGAPESLEARPADRPGDTPLSPDTPVMGVPEGSDALVEGVEEITVVRALRIISIGSDPPPPFTSALATWPPARLTFDESPIEEGWTPAAPSVVHSHGSDSPVIHIEARSEPETFDIEDRISEIPMSGSDEILEEIEPDATPFTTPPVQPKRPPPPPPKSRAEAKPAETKPTTEPPKQRPWWDDIFSDEYIRTMSRLDDRTIEREVDFIEESLGMEKHAVVLDLACGTGDHAVSLAGRGYNVVGLDYSKGMLRLADQRSKSRAKSSPGLALPSFVQGDMRELAYEEAFDGVYCWGTSIGYFDEEKNLAVLQKIHRALRQGGMFLIEVINRDYVAPRSPSLVWFEGQQCVCMDDMYVDFFTSRMRVKRTAMFEGGLSRELDYSIRLYTLHELGNLLHQVGFKVVEVTGHVAHPGVFFGTESPRLIVLAERS